MKNEASIDGVVVAGQPTDEEIASLPSRGVKTLVNVRLRHELVEPEGPKADAVGLLYAEVPFNSDTITFADVHGVRQALEHCAHGEVVVHCQGGTRAAVVTAIVAAERAREGHHGALRRIADAGFDIEGTAYEAFIGRYFSRPGQ